MDAAEKMRRPMVYGEYNLTKSSLTYTVLSASHIFGELRYDADRVQIEEVV